MAGEYVEGVEHAGVIIKKHWPVVLLGIGAILAVTLLLRNLSNSAAAAAAASGTQDTPPNDAALDAAGISAGVTNNQTQAGLDLGLAQTQAAVTIANLADSAQVASLGIQANSAQVNDSILANETAYNDTVFATQQLDQYAIGGVVAETQAGEGALAGGFAAYATSTAQEDVAAANAAAGTAANNDASASKTLGSLVAGITGITSTLANTGNLGSGLGGGSNYSGYGVPSSGATNSNIGQGANQNYVDSGSWDTIAADAALAA